MPDRHLHIISFDVPYPANYGGVIDVFHKVRTLASLGVKIHLHCFHYGRQHSDVLKEWCEDVYYYPRNMNRTLLINPLPFIMVSRQHDALLRHLKQDDHPILFEGKHTCYYLDHPELEGRKKFVRTHNVEADYYASLAFLEKNPLKRFYLKTESKKLKRYQSILSFADYLFSISQADRDYFSAFNENVCTVLPFHTNDEMKVVKEKRAYALYHGNLAVGENERAAEFLVKEVFSNSAHQLKIFGNGASKSLKNVIAEFDNVALIEGGHSELFELVSRAQVNILPTFQATGMKLKLLYSLFNGGHLLVNSQMVQGTGSESLVNIAKSAREFREQVDILMNEEFSSDEVEKRRKVLQERFSNSQQAQRIIDVIF